MGTLTYGMRDIPIEDRILAHLGVVITQKLRRRECFLLTLPSLDRNIHAESLWIGPTSDLVFAYSGNRVPSLDQGWLERMMTESYSISGLDLTTHDDRPGRPLIAVDGGSESVGRRSSPGVRRAS